MCLFSSYPLAFLKPHPGHTREESEKGLQLQQEGLGLEIKKNFPALSVFKILPDY